MKISTFEQAVGNTPLVPITRLHSGTGTVWVKLEMCNPFSVKDRAALFMLNAAEREGLWNPPAATQASGLLFWPPRAGTSVF